LAVLDLAVGFDELLSGLAEISGRASASVEEEPITKLEEGEMRHCAVLFADIKGFTALSEKLRADEVKLIIDHTFKILTQEIKRFNGQIDKYIGDCIMAVFGSEISGDNDSEMAIRAGLAMLDRLGQINTLLNQKGIDLGLRIGINYGEVVYGTVGEGREKDMTVMGDTVNTAQRMEANAPVNSILITGGTKKYLGDIFSYDDLEPILVKNKVEPIPVTVVKSVNHERRERWHRSSLSGRTEFVGRETELEELLRLFRQAQSESATRNLLAIIDGTPGIGKSRLLFELRNALRAETQGKAVIFKTVFPNYTARPYYALLDILKQRFSISDTDSQDEMRQKLAEGLSALSTGLDNEATATDSLPIIGSMLGLNYDDPRLKLDAASLETERRIAIKRVFTALAEHVVAETRVPLVLTVDDLQWADDGSFVGLQIVLDEVKASLPVLVILAHRADFTLPDGVAGMENTTRLTLGPLSNVHCKQVLSSMLTGLVLPDKLAKLFAVRSQGNPFFLEEIVQLLVELGVFRQSEEIWTLAGKIENITIPQSVHSIVLSRIDRLDKTLKELMQKASVIGTEFNFSILYDVLARVSRDLKPESTKVLLGELADRQMVFLTSAGEDGDDTYMFKNLLLQEAAYNTLLRTNRRILHKLTAEATENRYSDKLDGFAAVLGYHYELADEWKRAVDYYERAAVYFGGMCRYAEARKMYDSALRSLSHLPQTAPGQTSREISLTLSLLETLNSLGVYRDGKELAESIFERVQSDGTKSDLARIYRVTGVFAANLGDIETGLAHQDKARELCREIGDERTLGRILLTLGLIGERRGNRDAALLHFAEALDAATKGGDRNLEGSVHLNRGRIEMTLGKLDAAFDSYRKALSVFDELGDRLGKARSYSNIGIIAAMQGRYEDAERFYQNGLEINRVIGNRGEEARMLLNLGLVCFEQGEFADAVQYGTEAREIFAELGDVETEGMALGNLGLALEHTGDLESALKRASESLECAKQTDNLLEIGLRKTYVAKYLILSGGGEGDLEELSRGLALLDLACIPEYIAEGRLNLGQSLAFLGKHKEACAALESVIEMGGDTSLVGITRIARELLAQSRCAEGAN
jgi:class 3 adenylate cyclase/tetratricopeptide (TPR) repeat protein